MAFFDNIQANVGPKAAITDLQVFGFFDKYINPGDTVYVGVEVRDNKLFNAYCRIRDAYKSTIGKVMDWWNNYCNEKEVNVKINDAVYNALGFLLWGPGGAASYMSRQHLIGKLVSIHIARVISTSNDKTNIHSPLPWDKYECCGKCSYFGIWAYKNGHPIKKCLSVSGCPTSGTPKYRGYEDVKKCTIGIPMGLAVKCIYEWNMRHGVMDEVFKSVFKSDIPTGAIYPTRATYKMSRLGWWLFNKFYNIYIEKIAGLK